MNDLRLAFRQLAKSPGFTAVAVLTLALGIGLNTAMFTVVNTLLFKPAPYPDAARVVRIYRTAAQARTWPLSLPDLRDAAQQSDVFASLTPFQWWSFSLAAPGQPAEPLSGAIASSNLFTMLGVQPALGRAFTAEEQQPGRDNVAVLSYACWQQRFAGDPYIVGRMLRIDGASVEVVGVMPSQADYPVFWGRIELWRPLPLAKDWRENRDVRWLEALARLKPGVSLAQAQAELSGIAGRLGLQFPATNGGQGLRLVPIAGSEVDEVHRNLTWLTLGLAGFVLLIACANIGNLQLARSAARSRDFAIRAALGASRTSLIRPLLVETMVLALTGGALGLVLAQIITEALAPQMLDAATTGVTFAIDPRVIGFALGTALIAGVLSGCAPALLASRADVNSGLKQQARGTTSDRSRHRLRQALIVSQIAFCLVLLAGAGFFIRGLQRFMAHDPGWRIEGLLMGTPTLPDTRYANDPSRHAFHQRLLERVARLPGVERVALATALPLQGYNTPNGIQIEGQAEPPRGQEPLAYSNIVSAGYFATLGIELVEGRDFAPDARPDGPQFIVINETMARQFWPGKSSVGKRIRDTNPDFHPWLEIIGVVRDVTFAGNFGAVPSRLVVYRDIAQNPWGYFTLVLRSRAPEALVVPVRRAVAELDGDLPVANLRPVEQAVALGQHDLRIANQLLGSFAAVGLALAAIGLYGVISALVVQRTAEFGIRMALGAQRHNILWMVLGRGTVLAALGTLLGLTLAAGLLRVLGTLIPGLPGQDVWGLAIAVGLLLGVALAACWLPARRATRINPLDALRTE
jgi:putative ABC transport system permease protein